MYFKIALGNVKKTYKDYTIYFLTLTVAISLFYVFNSIGAQKSMMVISESENLIMENLNTLMGMVTVFISIVLGFLIVYANNFMMRRRKKEFGVYMTLGMKKLNIAKIILMETNLIGVIALLAGLTLGIFLSQGFSVITAKMFEVDMRAYRFVFSQEACLKTIAYFCIIFLIVISVSIISISQNKIINLMNADKKGDNKREKSNAVNTIIMIAAVGFIGAGYTLILTKGLLIKGEELGKIILIGSLGTLFLFMAMGGFFIRASRVNKKSYYKNLNMFVYRGINFRIKTVYVSMTIISLMLFVTIGVISTGLGMNKVLNADFSNEVPFDITITVNGQNKIGENIGILGLDLKDYTSRYEEISVYEEKNINGGELENIQLVKVSEFNKILELQGAEAVELKENEAIINIIDKDKDDLVDYCIKNEGSVKIGNGEYRIKKEYEHYFIKSSIEQGSRITVVLPDEAIKEETLVESHLSFNFHTDNRIVQSEYVSKIFDELEGEFTDIPGIKDGRISSKEIFRATMVGSRAMLAFVGIYIGIVFVIASSAVLAIQQLSDVSDNIKRFQILRKIGTGDSLLKKALFKQIGIYFMIPLVVAFIHSIVGVKVANDVIREVGGINATENIVKTMIGVLSIYGLYFLCTYNCCKGMIIKRAGNS